MPLKKYYISKNYSAQFLASSKAKTDCESIAAENGYRNIGLKQSVSKNLLFGRIYTLLSCLAGIIRLPRKSVLLLQYPVNFFGIMLAAARLKNVKVITIVHDLNSLRGGIVEDELRAIKNSHILIVHNNSMIEFLKKQGLTNPMISIELFDYLTAELPENKSKFEGNSLEIIYAGNLAKSSFLKHVNRFDYQKTIFKLFGIGTDMAVDEKKDHLVYKGVFPPEELPKHMQGSFGLVWDGESADTCGGDFGSYLKYNNPHKLSLYILCGLPVLVWAESATAGFVKKNGIGFTLHSLQEIIQLEKTLSMAEYDEMARNVNIIRNKLYCGYFFSKALETAEKQVKWN